MLKVSERKEGILALKPVITKPDVDRIWYWAVNPVPTSLVSCVLTTAVLQRSVMWYIYKFKKPHNNKQTVQMIYVPPLSPLTVNKIETSMVHY